MGVQLTQGTVFPGIWTAIQSGTGACNIVGIPTGYKLLRLEILSTGGTLDMTFNADAGAHYGWAVHGTTTNQGGTQSAITIASGQAIQFSAIEIVNLAAAIKYVTGTAGNFTNLATAPGSQSVAGQWTNNTDEINRITVTGTPVYWALFGASL